jgi:hypothetical protein
MLSSLRELFSFLSFFFVEMLPFLPSSFLTFFCFRIWCRIVQLFLYILFNCSYTCQNCSKLFLGFRLFSFLMLLSSPFDSSKTVQLPLSLDCFFKCCSALLWIVQKLSSSFLSIVQMLVELFNFPLLSDCCRIVRFFLFILFKLFQTLSRL